DRMNLAGSSQRFRAALRQPDIADLAGLHELCERTDRLFNRHRAVDAMEIEEVEVIRAQPLQALFAGGRDEPRRIVDGELAFLPRKAALAREEHVLPARAERRAHELLILTNLIAGRRVEMRHAAIDGGQQRGRGLRIVALAIPADEAHAAKTERGDAFASVAERTCLHRSVSI